ncbi:amidohydrolase [Microbacterium sp. M3]|uniref:Amidohydrolase n=1 Tax=Microbacterium arthrosphaerae TaxID=792652 RepID=A0ABU4H458_9MICO|nr:MULTISPECIES: amidohydrolase [Microbacterium]MDW4574120.1 amidohydrolase [Microbacterium arthrosphaerae]MDW7607975.1 amidohydrolase [Microbacterium sp. M3]
MTTTMYTGGRIFTASDEPWADALVVDGGSVTFAGDAARAAAAAGPDAVTVDLEGRLLLPGFTDAHTHLVMMGEALGRVPLTDARTLDEIQARLRSAREAQPNALRVLGRGWLFDSVPGAPTAAMIDAAVADVPVYLDANDYHSCWVNRAALAELGITRDTPDPLGGRIGRDADGEPDGMLYETAAVAHAWAFLAEATSDADRDAAVERTLAAYAATGVTGVVDMAFDERGLAAFQRAVGRRDGALPVRVAAHWLIENTGDETANVAQVRHAAELAERLDSPWLRVVGIKLVVDGVIDACTAAMRHPYSDGSNAEPIWSLDALKPVVAAADAAGLQVALHAIGDLASDIALDALEHAAAVNGPRDRRHRIEHLEYAAPGTAERMARLGVTASMQPVHADPAIFENWAAMLGDERVDRAFAWPEYVAAGALLAFSTDAPTAPHEALPNMYIAATRRSALDDAFAPRHPHFALPLAQALAHATRDAAASVGDGATRGRLQAGMAADFAIVDVDPFTAGPESLLTARVVRTVVDGEVAHDTGDL